MAKRSTNLNRFLSNQVQLCNLMSIYENLSKLMQHFMVTYVNVCRIMLLVQVYFQIFHQKSIIRMWYAQILISHPHGSNKTAKINPGDGLGAKLAMSY